MVQNSALEAHYLRKIIDVLHQKTHIDFDVYRQNFTEKRLHARMIRLKIDDYQGYLKHIETTPQEVDLFFKAFAINVSSFFRNIEVYVRLYELFCEMFLHQEAAENTYHMPPSAPMEHESCTDRSGLGLSRYLTQLSLYKKLNNQSHSTINIWSCPCAAGQEPYSIVMLLDHLSREIEGLPAWHVVASDIDPDALSEARSGVYTEDSMREVPSEYKNRYFTRVDSMFGYKYTITQDIKDQVEFINEDIINGHRKNEKYDIIFCRYLFIYIDRDKRDKILDTLINHLNTGGLLVLGKTETLFNDFDAIRLIDSRNHIYVKERNV